MSSSISPLAEPSVGIRIVTNMEVDQDATVVRNKLNTFFSNFNRSLKDQLGGTIEADIEYVVESTDTGAVFRGADIIFNAQIVPLSIVIEPVAFSIDAVQDDDEDLGINIEDREDTISETLENVDIDDIIGDTVMFSTVRGNIADIERPYIRTELGVALFNESTSAMFSKVDSSIFPNFKGIVNIETDLFGFQEVANLGETDIDGERIDQATEDMGDPDGAVLVAIDKGRI